MLILYSPHTGKTLPPGPPWLETAIQFYAIIIRSSYVQCDLPSLSLKLLSPAAATFGRRLLHMNLSIFRKM